MNTLRSMGTWLWNGIKVIGVFLWKHAVAIVLLVILAVVVFVALPWIQSVIVSKPAPATATSAVSVALSCPTEREFEKLTGVRADIDRTEPCSFHWRGDPATISVTHPCPSGWICTLGSAGQNYVYFGDDSLKPLQIFAGTWRLISQYASGDAVHNSCAFLAKVQEEGRVSDPQWTAVSGNLDCK